MGIKDKNIIPLGGKPLIAHTIEKALSSKIGRCIVSTDSRKIADVVREYGAEVPFMRPAELAGDNSSTISVLVHAVRWLQEHERREYDLIVLLQPTSPLRTTEDIDGAIELALKTNADSVISVSETEHHPYFIKEMDDTGILVDIIPMPDGYLRRQVLPKTYAPNGAVYVVKRETLLERESLFVERTYGYVMPSERSIDIDTEWDLRLTELILLDDTREEAGRGSS